VPINQELRESADDSHGSSAFAPKRDTPDALCEAGFSHMLAGRYPDAQLCAQRVLALDPAHADALHLMGLLCVRSGQYGHAVEWIARAIRQVPKPDYLANLGIALKQAGRLDEALQVSTRPFSSSLMIPRLGFE
jgi:tetratricopeptide (TPR) repeat protein